MKNIYTQDFGSNWIINPICLRYRPISIYKEWLAFSRSENKTNWYLKYHNQNGTIVNLFRKYIDAPLILMPSIEKCTNMFALFTELCTNETLKTYKDVSTANFLDIKIPLAINDEEYPCIDILNEYIQNDQSKKVLHIDFSDWVWQYPNLMPKLKEYYITLVGNNLLETLNAIDPVFQNTPHFVKQWNNICNVINNCENLEDLRIEIVFGSLVRDKHMTNSTPSYNNILQWSEKIKKELAVSEFNITYLHSCFYMDSAKNNRLLYHAQDHAVVCISHTTNTPSNIWRNK